MSENSFTESVSPFISRPGESIGRIEVTVTKRESIDEVIAERDALKRRVAELSAMVQRLEAEVADAGV